MKWDVVRINYSNWEEVQRLLNEGWEPFAATAVAVTDWIWLRKQRELKK